MLTCTAGRVHPAAQAQKDAGVQLWLSAPQIDWQYMMVRGGVGMAAAAAQDACRQLLRGAVSLLGFS